MKPTKTAEVITEQFEFEIVDKGGAATIDADLVFDPADPYAVTLAFRTDAADILWTFGRDLLTEGRFEPCGDGDVHVWPCLSSDGAAVVIIELCGPNGEVLVQTCSRSVNRFVSAMLGSVPEGEESGFVNFDDELSSLLTA